LANSVALLRKNDAFILWGINNATHELVGTSFNPYHAKILPIRRIKSPKA